MERFVNLPPRTAALLLALVGCGPRYDLGQVPIVGGTDEQRAAVVDELAAFDGWVGRGRVQLSEVELAPQEDLPGIAVGVYDRSARRILVTSELESEALAETLRHELCHAVDYQEDLIGREVVAFDDLADLIGSSPDHGLHDALSDDSQRRRRREAFAYLCQQGPLGAALLAHPCTDDQATYAAAAAWIAENVWTGAPDVVLDGPHVLAPERVTRPAPNDVEALEAVGSTDKDLVALATLSIDQDPQRMFLASVVDGTDIEGVAYEPSVVADPVNAGLAVPAPIGAPALESFDLDQFMEARAVSDGGTTLRIVEGWVLAGLGLGQTTHLIGHDGDTWSVVDGACPPAASSVFLANGQLYVAWAEETELVWSRVE